MESNSELKKIFRTIILESLPEVKRLNVMLKGRVTNVTATTVDFEALDDAGNPHPDFPEYKNIRRPKGISLELGDEIRIGFYYNDFSMPYVDAVI
ncbi:MAG: hypothetical protein JJT76_12835 [Clostridiaceae bacterium]|nr:hypothetical protein [Clostridiaceae bacterium]